MDSFKYYVHKFFRGLVVFFEIVLVVVAITVLSVSFAISKKTPSNDRTWVPSQKILPIAEFEDNGKVMIRNVRNASYKTVDDYTVNYYDREYDPSKLKKVWFILSPFKGTLGVGHAFFSFEFDDNSFVSISVEVRKEKSEVYSIVDGMLRDFELIYVVADERDVIRLRTDQYKDNVYLYPTTLDATTGEQLFRDMLMRGNGIAKVPEFYNTVTDNCITNLVYHINRTSPRKIPWIDYRVLFPANLDEYLYQRGFIDTNLPFSQIREKYLINPLVKKYADDPEFSRKIRDL
jgi:hypothetical protein